MLFRNRSCGVGLWGSEEGPQGGCGKQGEGPCVGTRSNQSSLFLGVLYIRVLDRIVLLTTKVKLPWSPVFSFQCTNAETEAEPDLRSQNCGMGSLTYRVAARRFWMQRSGLPASAPTLLCSVLGCWGWDTADHISVWPGGSTCRCR